MRFKPRIKKFLRNLFMLFDFPLIALPNTFWCPSPPTPVPSSPPPLPNPFHLLLLLLLVTLFLPSGYPFGYYLRAGCSQNVCWVTAKPTLQVPHNKFCLLLTYLLSHTFSSTSHWNLNFWSRITWLKTELSSL